MDVEQVEEGWRSAVDEAWTKLDTPAEPVAAAATPEPVAAKEEAPAAPDKAEAAPQAEGRPRGRDGKFVAKSVEAGKGTPAPSPSVPEAQAGADLPPAPPAPVSEALKAPQSWTPAEREEFAKATPAAQKAVLRREREIQIALQQAAGGKELAQAVAPYEPLFRQAGIGSAQAVGNVMQAYAALHSGTPQVKAQILAKLVGDFMGKNEASLRLLAEALDGAPAQTAQPQAMTAEQIRQLARQEWESAQAQAHQQQAVSAWQEFAASAPEHLESVRPQLAAVVNVWERQHPGQLPTPEMFKGFYEQACLMNPEISAMRQKEQAAQAIATANAATQKAKVASSSVKSQPGGPPAPPALGDDTRSHIAAAWDRAASR